MSAVKKYKWWVLASVVVVAVSIAVGYVVKTSDASIMNFLRETLLSYLRGKSAVERVLLATLFIGIGNALLIPINLLLFVTALLIPGWSAFVAGLAGSVLAACCGYLYGRLIGEGYVRKKLGEKFETISNEISRDAIKAVVLLSIAPVAPNILTNMLAGLCRMPVWKLAVGTLIGFLPGVAILTLLGRKTRALLNDPGYNAVIWIVGLVGLLMLSIHIGKRIKKRLVNPQN